VHEPRPVAQLYAEAVQEQRAENFDRAQALLRQVLALEPEHAEALNSLGLIAYRAHCYPEAVGLIGEALSLAPGRAAFCNNMGAVLSAWGRRREALASFNRAAAGEPADVTFRCNLANALKECGDFPAALEGFRAAIALDPRYAEAHFGAAVCLLALGRIAEAWPEHRWRVVSSGAQFPDSGRALYQGLQQPPGDELPADLRGRRLLVLSEQGLGDQLFFLRFAPVIKSLGARLFFFIPDARLASLLSRCAALEHAFSDPAQAQHADQILLVGDLPWAAIDSPVSTPPPLAIEPEPSALAAMKQRLARAGPPPYLGVTWRAGIAPDAGRPEALRKSVPVNAFASAVARWPGTALLLQRGPHAGEIDAFSKTSALPVHDCSDLNEDLIGMHALLALIEEYAGVSNTNMHLRAAAGRTARVLVAFPPEWRWLAGGAESPWFPGFRLYREEETGGWQPALERLAAELGDKTPANSPHR